MEKSFGLLFYLKKTKGVKTGDMYVYIRITVNNAVAELSTKRKWPPSQWNSLAGRAIGRTDLSKSLNSYLDVLQRKVYDIRKKLVDEDKPVTAENIKTILQGGQIHENKHLLLEIFKKHNDQMAELVGQEYSAATLERYNTSYKHTLSFIRWKYNVEDIVYDALICHPDHSMRVKEIMDEVALRHGVLTVAKCNCVN